MSKTTHFSSKLNFWHIGLLALVVIYFSVWLHEAAHWAVLLVLGTQPTMGFTGIIQQWDVPPPHPDQWQAVTYPALGTAWLRMQELPATDGQWAIMLIAGQLVPILLIVLGIWIYYRKPSYQMATIALMVVMVNGAMALTKLIGWWRGNLGDVFFFSFYSGLSYPLINGILIFLLGTGLVWSLRQLPCPVRRRWMRALVGAYALMLPLLMASNGMILRAIHSNSFLGNSWLGWSLPVWIVTLLMLVLLLDWLWHTRTLFPDNTEPFPGQ